MIRYRGNRHDAAMDRVAAMMAITDSPDAIRDAMVRAGESDDMIFVYYMAAKRIEAITSVRRERERQQAEEDGPDPYARYAEEPSDPFADDYCP